MDDKFEQWPPIEGNPDGFGMFVAWFVIFLGFLLVVII